MESTITVCRTSQWSNKANKQSPWLANSSNIIIFHFLFADVLGGFSTKCVYESACVFVVG